MIREIFCGCLGGVLFCAPSLIINENKNAKKIEDVNISHSIVVDKMQESLNKAEADMVDIRLQLVQQSVDLNTARARLAELQEALQNSDADIETLMLEKIELENLIAVQEEYIRELVLKLEQPNNEYQQTSIEYFTFDGPTITGFYGPEELKDIVIPTHYSLGEIVTETKEFTDIVDLDDYLWDFRNSLSELTISFVSGETFNLLDYDDFYDNYYDQVEQLLSNNGFATVTCLKQTYTNGYDYSLNKIGSRAFNGCSFNSVIVPEEINVIENSAFYNCEIMDKISIPNFTYTGIQYSSDPFNGSVINNLEYSCSGENFTYFNGVLNITASDDFGRLSRSPYRKLSPFVSVIVFVDNLDFEEINSSAFADTKITTIDLRSLSQLKILGNYSFENCKELETVYFPSQVIELKKSIFEGCEALKAVYVPAGMIDYYKEVYADYADYFVAYSE